jgi:hypothetical protein
MSKINPSFSIGKNTVFVKEVFSQVVGDWIFVDLPEEEIPFV